jgi:hypothetical protein
MGNVSLNKKQKVLQIKEKLVTKLTLRIQLSIGLEEFKPHFHKK